MFERYTYIIGTRWISGWHNNGYVIIVVQYFASYIIYNIYIAARAITFRIIRAYLLQPLAGRLGKMSYNIINFTQSTVYNNIGQNRG